MRHRKALKKNGGSVLLLLGAAAVGAILLLRRKSSAAAPAVAAPAPTPMPASGGGATVAGATSSGPLASEEQRQAEAKRMIALDDAMMSAIPAYKFAAKVRYTWDAPGALATVETLASSSNLTAEQVTAAFEKAKAQLAANGQSTSISPGAAPTSVVRTYQAS